jgi:hypothetical protein
MAKDLVNAKVMDPNLPFQSMTPRRALSLLKWGIHLSAVATRCGVWDSVLDARRRIHKVKLHVDLTILGRLAVALDKAHGASSAVAA